MCIRDRFQPPWFQRGLWTSFNNIKTSKIWSSSWDIQEWKFLECKNFFWNVIIRNKSNITSFVKFCLVKLPGVYQFLKLFDTLCNRENFQQGEVRNNEVTISKERVVSENIPIRRICFRFLWSKIENFYIQILKKWKQKKVRSRTFMNILNSSFTYMCYIWHFLNL